MSCGGKQRALTPEEARASLAARIGRVADRARGIATRLGMRPYRVFLVWVGWGGRESGEGHEVELHRHEILPPPKVDDLSLVAKNPIFAGFLPEGSLRVREISTSYTDDVLSGARYPRTREAVDGDDTDPEVPAHVDFFYEVVEDGRADNPAERRTFRVAASPNLDVDNAQWVVLLERRSRDRNRDGSSPYDEEHARKAIPDEVADRLRRLLVK